MDSLHLGEFKASSLLMWPLKIKSNNGATLYVHYRKDRGQLTPFIAENWTTGSLISKSSQKKYFYQVDVIKKSGTECFEDCRRDKYKVWWSNEMWVSICPSVFKAIREKYIHIHSNPEASLWSCKLSMLRHLSSQYSGNPGKQTRMGCWWCWRGRSGDPGFILFCLSPSVCHHPGSTLISLILIPLHSPHTSSQCIFHHDAK